MARIAVHPVGRMPRILCPHIPHLLMPGNIGENERGEAIVTMLNVSIVDTPGVRGVVKGKTLNI